MGNEKGGWLNKSGIVKKNKQWNFDENLKKINYWNDRSDKIKKDNSEKKKSLAKKSWWIEYINKNLQH